jgi:hypothetical protein
MGLWPLPSVLHSKKIINWIKLNKRSLRGERVFIRTTLFFHPICHIQTVVQKTRFVVIIRCNLLPWEGCNGVFLTATISTSAFNKTLVWILALLCLAANYYRILFFSFKLLQWMKCRGITSYFTVHEFGEILQGKLNRLLTQMSSHHTI